MKSLHDGATRAEVRERLQRLLPDSKPRWGRMSVAAMLCHLITWMEMALGNLPIRERRLFVRHPVVKQLIIYFMPIPKGLPTAPELIARVPAVELAADRATLEAELDRFGAYDPAAAWPRHPAFGRLTRREWGILAYRHTDHHLRQFGV